MKLHTLYKEQKLNITLDQAWDFFSSPANLKIITPPYMGFEIKSNFKNEKMFSGMIIEYIVKPVLSIPMRWVTEITHVKEKEYFIDEQRFGPYKFWHHLHQFSIENGELIMIDKLNYALPFGILGRIVNKLFVRKRIEEIFNYREKVLGELFSK
ncbi:MAG: SRPBCC family protein [Ignavibacteria bacterium]|nr:SRPBCC family protein [Ignavibacteria bacterium]